MYEEHFHLREKPFSMFPDPSYIYWGDHHRLAFAILEYGVVSGSGITVVTGDIGCGKTTLLRHLLDQLGDDIAVGLLSNTLLASSDLIRWVLMAFDRPFEQSNPVSAFRDFQQFVISEFGKGRRSLLVVDEAQNLSMAALEELRMLSNINSDKECLLQIVLTGQPQLRDMLRQPELTQFAQRVAADFHVEPLKGRDVHHYIAHRLAKADSPTKIFSGKACSLVAAASRGVPRTINLLCDTALVYAFARGQKYVTSHVMQMVIADKQRFGVFQPLSEPETSQPEQPAAASGPSTQLKSDTKVADRKILRLSRDGLKAP
jgi:type II secretory pathway predicted ATPase ExeA